MDGSVWCWGSNERGGLGDGTTVHRASPVRVNGLDDVIELETGLGYGCVRNQAGETWCWGRNQYGNLGDGSTTDRAEPVRVQTEVTFVDVAAGQLAACGVTAARTVWCWGRNFAGMLGDGSRRNRSVPVLMRGIDDALEVAVPGYYKTCVLRADRTVWCLGLNRGGQLGDGTTTDRSSPTRVRGLLNVIRLGRGATGYHMMATTMDQGTFSWGQGSTGLLGHGDTADSTAPRRIEGF